MAGSTPLMIVAVRVRIEAIVFCSECLLSLRIFMGSASLNALNALNALNT